MLLAVLDATAIGPCMLNESVGATVPLLGTLVGETAWCCPIVVNVVATHPADLKLETHVLIVGLSYLAFSAGTLRLRAFISSRSNRCLTLRLFHICLVLNKYYNVLVVPFDVESVVPHCVEVKVSE